MVLTLTNLRGRVLIQGEMFDSFKIERELKQGDSSSTLLFNLVLEDVIRNLNTGPNGRLLFIIGWCGSLPLQTTS